MARKLIALSLLFTTFFFVQAQEESKNYQDTFDPHLKQMITEMVGVQVSVLSPKLGIDYSGAAGFDTRGKEQNVETNQPFRIASITKTFVAVALLRLEEQGLLSIDDPISKYISKEHIQILKSDKYNPDLITIKSCMNHTSGLFDYAMSKDDYPKIVAADPYHRWTRTEQIKLAMKIGKPVNKVGAEYHYSDTGYVLLGEILEKVTGKGLAASIRETVGFEQLDLNSTWLETMEDHPRDGERRVGRYLDEHDASDWDPSVDLYGGGGLISTSADLAKFMTALFEGNIFEKEGTLEKMLEKPNLKKKASMDYRLGIIYQDFGQVEAYLHSGLWGVYLFYFPALEAAVAINYTDVDDNGKIGPMVKEIMEIKKAKGI